MENIISVKNLSKTFDKSSALKDISFHVAEGEIFGFLGPSGSGKTTTIKILTSQLLPSSGVASVLGSAILDQNREVLKDMGVLTDNSGLYERLTIKENLELFADIHKIKKTSVTDLLDKVGLLQFENREVKKLSKGMKQRVMLARAILHKPRLLFLDEPTSALDPGTTIEIHKLLVDLNREGTTIFLTTHNMHEADKLCNRVAFLDQGEIVEVGNPQKLKFKYSNNLIDVTLNEDEKVHIVANDSAGSAMIQKWMLDGKVIAIHSKEPSLEEIFLQLTGRGL